MPCPICESGHSYGLVAQSKAPVFQNAIYKSAEEAASAATASLDFRKCSGCGFVWNDAFHADLITYSADYNNSQVHSDAFQDHLSQRADRILAALPGDGPVTIVEIGCGQGDFLLRLAEAAGKREVTAIGFDPAWRGETKLPENAEIHDCYFTAESASLLRMPADVIVSRHTIEHVPDPVPFLSAIRRTLPEESGAKLFLETPDHSWILETGAWQDFFYEHCSLFDFSSMGLALQKSGFVPEKIESCFERQYLWVEAAVSQIPLERKNDILGGGRDGFSTAWRTQIEERAKAGKVALWGAGAKGSTFALMTDPECALIDCVIDSNPDKVGGFIGVTGHRIVSPSNAADRALSTIVVMNPNYEQEIRRSLQSNGIAAELLVLR